MLPPRALLPVCPLLLAGTFAASPVGAQYTVPGTLGLELERRQDRLERILEETPWRLGPVYLQPWIGLENLTYIDEVTREDGERHSDLTASVGAGLRAYARTGSNIYWAAYAQPQYRWWRRSRERRGLREELGAGAFAFFHRLNLHATGQRQEHQQILSEELLEEVEIRSDRADLEAELRLFRGLAAFGSLFVGELRHAIDLPDADELERFRRLDRDTERHRVGLRLRSEDRWMLGAGVGRSLTEFLRPELDRSNRGRSVFAEGLFRTPRSELRAGVERSELDPEPGSAFRSTRVTTGDLTTIWDPGGARVYRLYGRRSVRFTPLAEFSHVRQDRIGVGMTQRIGWRTRVSLAGEVGRERFQLLETGAEERRDRVRAASLDVELRIRQTGRLQLGMTYSSFRSPVADADRSVTRFRAGISFAGAGSPW